MAFVDFDYVRSFFRGKSVAIVGSGPSVLYNAPGFIDSHDLIVRVNNYRTSDAAGHRCDVHYSFYGNSIKVRAHDLIRDGVRLCMCKCPNSKPIACEWHERNNHPSGVNFTYIYKLRAPFWFTETYVPDDASFLAKMALLDGHVPTTGFAAILDVLACEPASILLTGFDFFQSKTHNVNERWRPGDPSDPIGHRPELERAWIARNAERFILDPHLVALLASTAVA